jgi:hypothetical protein
VNTQKKIPPTLSERVDILDGKVTQVDDRLEAGDKRMQEMTERLEENTLATQRTEANTADIVEILQAWKGAFKVLVWVGKLAKPMGAIVGLGVAIYGAWVALKTGAPPK